MIKDCFFEFVIGECKSRASRDPSFYGWEASIIKRTSYQELLYPGKPGASKASHILAPQVIRWPVEEVTYKLAAYARHGDPVLMGNAQVTLDTDLDIRLQIESVIDAARSVGNKPWQLVQPSLCGKPGKVRLSDPELARNPQGAAREIRKRVNSSLTGLADKIFVNYGELFINSYKARIVTSRGLDYGNEGSDIYFEAASEKLPGPNTQEVHKRAGSLSARDFDAERFCCELAEEVLSLGETELPDTDTDVALLVSAETASAILHCLLGAADASREYAKKPFLAPGMQVHKGELSGDSETLSFRLDPHMDFMAESATHTNDGLIAEGGEIASENILKQRFVSNRMSQYLGIDRNPVLGNVVVRKGTKSFAELTKAAPKVIEIKSFSSLLLNVDYLTYSSEIKLAREYDNDTGRTRLLKGGVVSGNIMENLSSFFSSDRIETYNMVNDGYSEGTGYRGPKYWLFKKGVTISGRNKP